jgi:hypothetical protein
LEEGMGKGKLGRHECQASKERNVSGSAVIAGQLHLKSRHFGVFFVQFWVMEVAGERLL